MGFMHQQLIEVLSYAMVLTVRCSTENRIFILNLEGGVLRYSFKQNPVVYFVCRAIIFLHQEQLALTPQLSAEHSVQKIPSC